MQGINRDTGRALSGWDHVVQSLQVIFSTRFHERVMRRWFGSLVPHMLGENVIPATLLRFFYSVVVAVELWEPRFRIVQVRVLQAGRDGGVSLRLDGEYFPNAQVGDYVTNFRRSLVIVARESGLVISPFESAA